MAMTYIKWTLKQKFLVDSNYRVLKEQGINVFSLEEVLGEKNQCFLIAVNREKTAKEIELYLLKRGIEREKIRWY